MMERTYGRRKPGSVTKPTTTTIHLDSLNDAVSDPFAFRDYLSPCSSQDTETTTTTTQNDFFSQESSSSFWPSSSSRKKSQQNGVVVVGSRPSKKPKKNGVGVPLTSTLMETQEFGEMMENVDEVNFALDGLRRGQQVRIRRASLLSLLSISASPHQRRFLRAQGISKTIIDAVLGLSLDDTPSNLAAATLFFVLTSDGPDEHLLESPSCIQFLIKLLKPVVSTGPDGKARKIGYKLLSLLKDADAARDTTKMQDLSASDIVSKVQEILVGCKEIKSTGSYKSGTKRPELCPKWIALMTMEKACLSKISFEDTSGTMRKSGGNFKEKLRELGGLDAVFEVAMNCYSVLERWLDQSSHSDQDMKDDPSKQSLMLLLKCLKIMENATFLSTDNQTHLLGMRRSLDSHGSQLSFTELMISVIKILSGLYLWRSSPAAHRKEKSSDFSNGVHHDSNLASVADCEVNNEIITISSTTCSTRGCTSSRKSISVSHHNSQSTVQLDCSGSGSGSETSTTSRVGSSIYGSIGGRLRSFGSDTSRSSSKHSIYSSLEESQDPYAFDLEDFEPSKWDVLSGKQKIPRAQKRKERYIEIEDESQHRLTMIQEQSDNRFSSQEESSNGNLHNSHQISDSRDADEECLNRLSDCLLAAVKVLMNLTNDNAIGCRQIAVCGGLETMSTLIARHFSLFSLSPSLFNEKLCAEGVQKNDKHLTDQELDFLVAILGLLVNLVEKDGLNRSRLAAASVSVPNSEGLEESERDVIPLFCSIFLANRGAADTSEEAKLLTLDDEEAVLEGEKEAEKMIVEAYSALLLAFLSTERSIRNAIANHLPNHNLAVLVPVLERFVAFHLTLNMIPPETHKAVSEVIESCRVP